jgi:hypothetical protein
MAALDLSVRIWRFSNKHARCQVNNSTLYSLQGRPTARQRRQRSATLPMTAIKPVKDETVDRGYGVFTSLVVE